MRNITDTFNFQKDIISVERNGHTFQVSKSPFSTRRYKSSKHQYVVIGYRYSLDMHMAIGHANMDSIEQITVGETHVWNYDWYCSVFASRIAHGYSYSADYLALVYPAEIIKESNIGPAATQTSSEDAEGNKYWLAQTFTTTSSYSITALGLSIWRHSGPWGILGNITISIKATDVNGLPTGDDLCFTTIDASVFPDVFDYSDWTIVQFDNPCILNTATKYAIVVRLEQKLEERWFNWQRDITDQYVGGSLKSSIDDGVTWVAHPLEPTRGDCLFKTYTRRGYAPNNTIRILAEQVFGGDEKEGGISGNADLLFGDIAQAQNSYLASKIDSDVPAYRGITSLVLKDMYLGMTPYISPWSFLCKRVSKQISGDAQWYKEKSVIRPRETSGDDLNPAHIIRECLIDKEFGLGWEATDDIDNTSFVNSADILYDEEFGLSLLWDQITPMEDFIGVILNCIAGTLYQDLETGKWVLDLIRPPNIGGAIISNTDAVSGGTIFERSILTRYTLFQLKQYQAGQTFVATESFDTDKIQLLLHTVHHVTVRLEVQGVKDDDDYNSIYKIPNGNVLAYGEVTEADIPATAGWVTFTLNKKVHLVKGQTYSFIFYVTASDVQAYLYYDIDVWTWGTALSNVPNGSYVLSTNYGGTWGASGTTDILGFKILKADVDSYNEDNIEAIEDFVRPAYGEIVNTVTVNWWDKIENKSRPADADDIALIAKQNGRIVSSVLNMYGICNATLASKVANRELKLASSMLASVRLRANRTMSHLKPNSIFRLSWSEYGISNMLLRVIEVNYGSLLKNDILLNCIEEQDTAEAITVGAPADDTSIALSGDPIAVVSVALVEIPYWMMCADIADKATVDAYATTLGRLLIAAVPPVSDAYDFSYFSRLVAPYSYVEAGTNAAWCPSATVVEPLYMEADDITIDIVNASNIKAAFEVSNDTANDTNDGSIMAGTYAIIDSEIVKVLAIDEYANQIQIARGIMDTMPAKHSAGSRIYFIGSSYELVANTYAANNAPSFKLLPRTLTGKLDVADATEVTASALNRRIIRPYLPANLKFNAERFPTFLSSKAASKFTLTWNHRDRTNVTQLETIVEHTTATDYGPETGTTYNIKVYNAANVLKRTVTGLSVKTYDYTNAFEISDCGSLQSQLRFVIYSVRAGFDSFQKYDVLIKRSFEASATPTATVSGSMQVEKLLSSSSCVVASTVEAAVDLPVLFGASFGATATAIGNIDVQRDLTAALAEVSAITGTMAELASEA